MNPDDQMDDLLRNAGQRWRAASPAGPSAVDFDAIAPAGASRQGSRTSRWLVAASAALVVALLAAGTAWFATRPGHSPNGATGQPVDTRGLVGTNWVLLIAFGATEDAPNDGPSTYPPLRFSADGKMTASDGCNTISGPATIGDSTIHFGNLATTEIGCGNDPRAAIIDAVLQGDASWKIADTMGVYAGTDHLTISKPGAGTLTYEGRPVPKPVTDPSKMPGTWQLIELDHRDGPSAESNGGSESASQVDYGELLVISPDGSFKVQNRCYANAGNVAITEGKATWSNVHLADSIPCPATETQQDEQTTNNTVDKVLSGATTWLISVSGDLSITKGDDTLVYAPYATDDTTPSAGSSS